MSTSSVVSQLVGGFGALGIGSVIGQYVASGGSRRQSRAAVLEALVETENGRWAGWGMDRRDYRRALTRVETACLLARLPRELVHEYTLMAATARDASQEDWEESGGNAHAAGAIDTHYADAVMEAARRLADVIWAPIGLRRLAARRGTRRVQEALGEAEEGMLVRQARVATYI